MTTDNRPGVDALMEEAARWHARLDCGTADPVEFERWRNADPRHAAAFARIVGAVGQVDDLKPAIKDRVRPISRRAAFEWVAASAVVLLFGGISFLFLTGGRVSAETPVGGSLERLLADGSRIHLNTDSKVHWRIDDRHRELWLERGEIALTVLSSDVPIYIHGAGQTVVVKSGKINARLRSGALDLLVQDGTANVQVTGAEPGKQAKPVAISQGQAVLVSKTNTRVRLLTPDEVQLVSAWQGSEVYFNGETLGSAVEEYNRYLRHKITIGDPSLQGIRLGGRFDNRDPRAFLTSLHDAFGIVVTETPDGSVVLTR